MPSGRGAKLSVNVSGVEREYSWQALFIAMETNSSTGCSVALYCTCS